MTFVERIGLFEMGRGGGHVYFSCRYIKWIHLYRGEWSAVKRCRQEEVIRLCWVFDILLQCTQ